MQSGCIYFGTACPRFVPGRQRGDADLRVHTSCLRQSAPPPGRLPLSGLRAAP